MRHEQAAKRRMLAFLHVHCPETRHLTEWALLWAYVDPEDGADLHTVHFTVPETRGATLAQATTTAA